MPEFIPTKREQDILDLKVLGIPNKEIAQKLGMAYPTVKAHFNRMYLKAGIVDGIKHVKLVTMLLRRP